MDEVAKKCLYKQLVEMSENNLYENPPKILNLDDFMNLPDNILLEYVFLYRDMYTKFNNENGDMYFIELPSMDLSGQDLSMCFLHNFCMSTLNENSEFVPSTINLSNTNANICITGIMPSRIETNLTYVDEHIFDFNIVNFKGCNVYGFLPDENQEDNVFSRLGYKLSVERKRKWIR